MKSKILIVFIILSALVMIGWQNSLYSNPESVFEAYKRALNEGDIETYMSCISKGSQQMFSQRPLQISLMKREYQDITQKYYKVTIENETAILEFVPESKIAPPYLFKKEDGEWKIDLKRMSEEIVFDEKNYWRWR